MQMLVALSYARECSSSRCRDEGDTGFPPNKRPEGALIYFYAKVRSLEERERETQTLPFCPTLAFLSVESGNLYRATLVQVRYRF
jgi:hypothetical protein